MALFQNKCYKIGIHELFRNQLRDLLHERFSAYLLFHVSNWRTTMKKKLSEEGSDCGLADSSVIFCITIE